MICFPNAKINLGLNIVEKRPDGYHNIETVFYPIPIKDALEITEAPATSFTQTGIPVDAPAEKNLVMKALRAIRQNYTVPELQIGLLKAIPFGAGLGGGSADAAFMLKLVNQFAHLQISDDELERIASTIGADCPFSSATSRCLPRVSATCSSPSGYRWQDGISVWSNRM